MQHFFEIETLKSVPLSGVKVNYDDADIVL